MDEPTRRPAAESPPADEPQAGEVPAEGQWLWSLPAAAVGAVALLLIAYGQFIQPRLLPGKYARHLTLASRDFEAAVSPDNSGRTVAESLTLLRRARLAYQRLESLRPDDRALQFSHGGFAATAATDLQRWLYRDRGYLRPDERERLRSVAFELRSEADRLLVGLLAQKDDVADRAAAALAERVLVDPRAARVWEKLEAYAAAREDRPELRAAVASAKVAIAGTLLPWAGPGGGEVATNPLTDLLAVFERSDRELAAASRMLVLLQTDPAAAHSRAVERAVEDLAPSGRWMDRVARLQVLCVAGKWNQLERRIADALASAETAEELEYMRRRVGDACMTALRCGLAEAVPAWGETSDRCQNIVLQLDSGRPDAAAIIEPICRGEPQEISAVIARSLSRSELSPLREVLKSLYLGFHDEPTAAAAAVVAGGEVAIQPLCQLILQIASRSPADADRLENLTQSLTEKRPESGTAWYTLAFLQSRREDQSEAAESLDRARALLGPVAAVEALGQRLEQNREAMR